MWELLPTPNPNESALRVWADKGAALALQGRYTEGVTTLKEFELATAPSSEQLEDYVFTEKQGPDNDGRLAFIFVRDKTDAEIATPFTEGTETEDGVTWPGVLEFIDFVPEYAFPLSQTYLNGAGGSGVATTARYRVPRIFVPPWRGVTQVSIREFTSHKPFPDWAVESDEPQPTEVAWDLIGHHGSIVALHKDVSVPNQNTLVTSNIGGTVATAASSSAGTTFYPATNHENRRDYVVNLVTRTELGIYHRVEKTYHAPADRRRQRLDF